MVLQYDNNAAAISVLACMAHGLVFFWWREGMWNHVFTDGRTMLQAAASEFSSINMLYLYTQRQMIK